MLDARHKALKMLELDNKKINHFQINRLTSKMARVLTLLSFNHIPVLTSNIESFMS